MIKKILEEVYSFNLILAELREQSPYYPDMIIRFYGKEMYASTILRKEHEGIWYAVHHVQCVKASTTDQWSLKERLHHYVYQFILFGKIDPKLVIGSSGQLAFIVDKLQISEAERLGLKLN